jgi:hydroxyacylglutathione hydrolase
MLNITALPALRDNYIWTLHNAQFAVVVDPSEAAPVLDFLQRKGLNLTAILCTHRHHDHVGGIAELRELYRVPVYGHAHPDNPHITDDVREGDHVDVLGTRFAVLEVKGHLDDHVAFVTPEMVFCGDVLFGAGCGRNFEGTLLQLFESLKKLAALPDNTHVYCAHEYTLMNLRFAQRCEPNNPAIIQRIADARALLAADLPTLPSTIALEKATNPFLRCTKAEVIQTLQARGLFGMSEFEVFSALREWRNGG